MSGQKYMDVAEFQRQGYLQELNRRFLHPLGLALEVQLEEDSSASLVGIWDCRDDPEGIILENIDPAKAAFVDLQLYNRQDARRKLLGSIVQGVPFIPTPIESE